MSKRNYFITFGLLLIAFLVFIGRNTSIYAAVKDGAKFGDWVVTCETENAEKSKKNKTCYLSQVLTKDDKKIAEFKIGYFGKDKKLQMLQVLPLGVNVTAGSAIIVGQEVTAQGRFLACYNYGCLAVADLTEAELRKLYNKEDTFIGIIISDVNKQVNLKFSTKGLKAGLDALK